MHHDWIDAAKLDEIPENECKIIDLNGDEVALYNLAGEYFAIEDVCTHDGGDLSGGRVEDGATVCPRHLAKEEESASPLAEQWLTATESPGARHCHGRTSGSLPPHGKELDCDDLTDYAPVFPMLWRARGSLSTTRRHFLACLRSRLA